MTGISFQCRREVSGKRLDVLYLKPGLIRGRQAMRQLLIALGLAAAPLVAGTRGLPTRKTIRGASTSAARTAVAGTAASSASEQCRWKARAAMAATRRANTMYTPPSGAKPFNTQITQKQEFLIAQIDLSQIPGRLSPARPPGPREASPGGPFARRGPRLCVAMMAARPEARTSW